MHHLGQTRSVRRAGYILQTPDTFVRAPLPGMQRAMAIVHVSPAAGARFTQYTVEFEAAGVLAAGATQRFIYVLEGAITVAGKNLAAGEYAYLPAGHPDAITATSVARAAVFEKPYQALAGTSAPGVFFGRESDVAAVALGGDPWLEVRSLVPADVAFDFAVNTMTYQPGAALSMVEVHVMEHGMLMLEGGGIYRLGDDWHAVDAGDFIWMAAYCPQWYGALGKKPGKYLIYKDWNRAY